MAFPGAEGFGRLAKGGRGGKVFEVTSLADSGPGSLRAAVEASGPRTVVFRTGGTITLKSKLTISNPFITVAGQTAPGGGVAIKGDKLTVVTDNVILRHLRLRPGPTSDPGTGDALQIIGSSHDVIVDHLSMSWAVDEVFSTSSSSVSNITVQWCIIGEALNCATPSHPEGCHGKGALLGGGTSPLTFHHNLLLHNPDRNPYIQGGDHDLVNNLIYNWAPTPTSLQPAFKALRINVVGNHYKPGPLSPQKQTVRLYANTYAAQSAVYLKGNIDPVFRPDDTLPEEAVVKIAEGAGLPIAKTPFPYPAVTTTTATQAYAEVLAGAGATLPARDAVDQRLVESVKQGTGKVINDPSEVGGWPALAAGTAPPDGDHDGMPDAWETAQGLDPKDPGDGALDKDGDGYTNLEEYLNDTGTGGTAPGGDARALDARRADGAPSGGGDTEAPRADGSAVAAGDSGRSAAQASEGCGCQTVPPGAGSPWLLVAAVLLWRPLRRSPRTRGPLLLALASLVLACSEEPGRLPDDSRRDGLAGGGADASVGEGRSTEAGGKLLDGRSLERRPGDLAAAPALGPRPVASSPAGAGTLYVSPAGSGTACTQASPCAIGAAIQRAVAGDLVFLLGGVYKPTQKLYFSRSGTSTKPIVWESHPGQLAIFDGSGLPGGVYLNVGGSFQVLRKLEIRNFPQEGLYIDGNDNRFEGLDVHHNKTGGIHIFSPYEDYPYGKFGSRNTIIDCVTHDNSDAGLTGGVYANGGNADGIAISSGEANQVLHCLAYGNSDDGVDTWRSTNSLVAHTISHSNGLAAGDGNGFKAGGLPPSSGTVVERCLAYKNRADGYDFNSGASVKFRRLTSWANTRNGFTTGSSTTTERCIASGNGATVDGGGTFTNNSWQKAGTVTFLSTDPASPDFLRPTPGGGFEDLGAYAP